MASTLSLSGIEKAISGLNYRDTSLKSKVVNAIRQYYDSAESLRNLQSIDSDRLIRSIWETGDDLSAIQAKRKNFNSVKSSINADFLELFDKEKNPEGVIISPSNIFVMSDEAKDKFLRNFSSVLSSGGNIPIDGIAAVLNIVSDLLSELSNIHSIDDLEKLKGLIRDLSDKVGISDRAEKQIVRKAAGSSETAFEEALSEEDSIDSQDAEQIDAEDGGLPDETLEEAVEEPEPVEIMEVLDGESEEADAEIGEAEEEIADLDQLETIDEDELDEAEEIKADDEDLTDAPDLEEVAEEDDQTDDAVEVVDLLEEDESEEADAEIDAAEEEIADLDQLETIDEDELDEAEEIEADDEDLTDAPDLEEDDQTDDAVEVVDVLDEEDAALEDAQIEEFTDAVEDLNEADEAEADQLDEVDESEVGLVAVAAESDADSVGLPVAMTDGGEFSLEELDAERERKKILAEKFDGYLGAMERYYNQYVLIPKGEYIIGSKKPKKEELPEQRIALPNFYVGKYPVTNALFEVFIENTGYKTTAEELGYGTVYHGRFQKKVDKNTGRIESAWNATYSKKVVQEACWYQPSGPGSTLHNKRNHPVVQVSLKDAMAFAAWSGKRLPAEFEWEAASRASKGNIFPWGNEWENGLCNIEDSAISDTTPVDSYPKATNELGVSDTLGNVLEWTADECDPPFTMDGQSTYHIVKGGSWISDRAIRLYSRFRIEIKFTSNILGFRCLAD